MSGALRFSFVIAIIVTILHSYVSAQTVPMCLPGYQWAYNSLQQSPCEMVALLEGFSTLVPISGPAGLYGQAANDPRECNTVYYSLLSACSLCQNGTWFNWSIFTSNCTMVYIAQFPASIPSSTRIPHYAYLNVTSGNTFDPSAALNAGGFESTAAQASASASATATATSATTSLAATPPISIQTTVISTVFSPSPTSPAESKKSNAGAIAGGVVGGLSFLGIVVALIAFIILRGRRRSGPSGPIPAVASNSVASSATIGKGYGNGNYSSAIPPSGRLYDPNDPTTYPITYPVGYGIYSNQPGSDPSAFTTSGNRVSVPVAHPPTHYTGAPEP